MVDVRAFHEALKPAQGPSQRIQTPLRSSPGNTLLTNTKIKSLSSAGQSIILIASSVTSALCRSHEALAGSPRSVKLQLHDPLSPDEASYTSTAERPASRLDIDCNPAAVSG